MGAEFPSCIVLRSADVAIIWLFAYNRLAHHWRIPTLSIAFSYKALQGSSSLLRSFYGQRLATLEKWRAASNLVF